MKVRRIGVIGRTAFDTDLCDGQTVKTRVLVEELKRKYPQTRIHIVDTYNYKKTPWKLLQNLFDCVRCSDVIFILLSRNGMRVIFPIVNLLNRFYRKPILHDCIGGALDHLIERYSGLKKQLNRFDTNWVESRELVRKLRCMGVHNVEYLPNFKRLTILSPDDLRLDTQKPYRFCTFSRVNEAKGIGRAAEAVITINRNAEKKLVCLDVFGPIEDHYDQILNRYIDESAGAVSYKGVADPSGSVTILKDYYALLFPTTFAGEGFPGTLIDAFSAGLPVIATDWHCNGEIIQNGYSGYLYPADDSEQLRWLMERMIEDTEKHIKMRKNCLQEAARYNADNIMKTIEEKIEQVLPA